MLFGEEKNFPAEARLDRVRSNDESDGNFRLSVRDPASRARIVEIELSPEQIANLISQRVAQGAATVWPATADRWGAQVTTDSVTIPHGTDPEEFARECAAANGWDDYTLPDDGSPRTVRFYRWEAQ